jgi:hypothetical protein
MESKFHSFNDYLRGKFGERVHRVNIDAGFNCPNLDGTRGTEGCSYCNNKGFSLYAGRNIPIEKQIEDSIAFYTKKMGVKKFIAYFQAFTNTHAPVEVLSKRYSIIRRYPQIVGLSISTRPDCVDEPKLDLIAGFAKDYLVWVEYGLQTTHDHILKAINRGHTYEDFLKALKNTRDRGISAGVHMIIGLPGQSDALIAEDAVRLASLDIQGVKFHVLHILKGTTLEAECRAGKIKLFTQDEYIKAVCDFIERLPKNVVILRLVSSALNDYLVAPGWLRDKSVVIDKIKGELEKRKTFQGIYAPHTF